MKIQLEFEDEDLKNMILQYFEREGFIIKNIEELCSKFKEAFPDGLKVYAELAPQNNSSSLPPLPEEAKDWPTYEEAAKETLNDEEPILKFDEIMSEEPSIGRRELNKDVADIGALVRKSRSLESVKK